MHVCVCMLMCYLQAYLCSTKISLKFRTKLGSYKSNTQNSRIGLREKYKEKTNMEKFLFLITKEIN